VTEPVTTPAPRPRGGGNALSRPVAGVPVWGWVAIVVVVGGGIYLMRMRSAGRAAAEPVPTVPAPAAPTVGNMPMTTSSDQVRILTNNQWAQAAQKYLIQHGYDASDVADAVQNYINGEKLTAGQSDLIDAALVAIGPLPHVLDGAASKVKVSPLHTPRDGNIFGHLLFGAADFLGLDEPGNPFSPFILPFVNNVIDQGPIGGFFQSVNDVLGGSVSLSGQANQITVPGLGTFSLGGQVSTSGVGGNVGIPGVGSIGLGVNPNTQDRYLAPYTVQPGDTLTSISKKVYGSTGGAQVIYSANISKIPNPSKLAVGTVLQIPAPNSNA